MKFSQISWHDMGKTSLKINVNFCEGTKKSKKGRYYLNNHEIKSKPNTN